MKNHRKLIAGIIMIIISSLICGGIAGYLAGANRRSGQMSLRELRDKLFKIMVKDLKLTPDQQVKAGKILDDGMGRMVEFRIRHAPEILMIIKENNQAFKAILDPEQQKIYEDYRQQKLEAIKGKLFADY